MTEDGSSPGAGPALSWDTDPPRRSGDRTHCAGCGSPQLNRAVVAADILSAWNLGALTVRVGGPALGVRGRPCTPQPFELFLQRLQLLLGTILDPGEDIPCVPVRTDQLVKLEVDRLRIAVLGRLDEEDHQ